MSYAYFDRFDIAEAHYVFAMYYHSGGDTPRRDFSRLRRMGFRPAPNLDLETLTMNGLAIYGQLAKRDHDADQRAIAAGRRLS